jgi:hypothetical protein
MVCDILAGVVICVDRVQGVPCKFWLGFEMSLEVSCLFCASMCIAVYKLCVEWPGNCVCMCWMCVNRRD